jgi:hypothetical protein
MQGMPNAPKSDLLSSLTFITVNGGDPTAGSDVATVSGTVGC